jgi:phosphoribulokinase
VLAEMNRRIAESEAYIQPQRSQADIVVRFAPIPSRDDLPATSLSAELVLRPTIRHPDLSSVLADHPSMFLKLCRDIDGRPVDTLHVHGDVSEEESRTLEKAIWALLDQPGDVPYGLGMLSWGQRSGPLAVTQLLLLFHMLDAA